jgi:uncharacterized repeat protein (TIGR03803 family)
MNKLNRCIKVYGVFLLSIIAATALPAQTFTTLHNFDATAGAYPQSVLVQGADGNFYGTTFEGGASNGGTVFSMTADGTLTALHSFSGYPTDGLKPFAGLILGTDGNFYGTTSGGGTSSTCVGEGGCGTVFRITPNGILTTLHSFDGTDGAYPYAALIQGIDGNFYGTTYGGDSSDACGEPGCGTIFKITPRGTLTTLHNFCSQTNCADGDQPVAGLVQGTDGRFYGTTFAGTIFHITAGGALTTIFTFDGTNGLYPEATLVQGADGEFYGTTHEGGTIECANGIGCGTVFKITPEGALTTLYNFCSQQNCADGSRPQAGLIQGTDGNFYGATFEAGANDAGTVFSITPGGALIALHSFCSQSNCADGGNPFAGLLQDTNGTFYGTTLDGGTGNLGTVFSLSVGLAPFVETNPGADRVGARIGILGSDLTGATSVTFSGKQSEFKVVSKTLIVAKVPTGATTGTVKVVIPGGTLSSNVPFHVLP